MSIATANGDLDEVKVFRSTEVDDLLEDHPHSSQQLKEDKKDVACEMDLETTSTNNPCQRNIFFDPNRVTDAIVAQNSQNMMYPFLMLKNAMASPQYANLINSPAFQLLNSPGFAALNLGSPHYGQPSAFVNPMFQRYQTPMFPNFAQFPFYPIPNIHPSTSTTTANSTPSAPSHTPKRERAHREKRDKDHVKKPCNAFMLYMQMNRQKFVEECNVKQSSELNKEMGRQWHNLAKEEQEKYFEMARQAKEEHARMYPNWTARENYAINKKKRKKQRERSHDPDSENNETKKCRARFGIDRQEEWCKSCRRKKRCLILLSN